MNDRPTPTAVEIDAVLHAQEALNTWGYDNPRTPGWDRNSIELARGLDLKRQCHYISGSRSCDCSHGLRPVRGAAGLYCAEHIADVREEVGQAAAEAGCDHLDRSMRDVYQPDAV